MSRSTPTSAPRSRWSFPAASSYCSTNQSTRRRSTSSARRLARTSLDDLLQPRQHLLPVGAGVFRLLWARVVALAQPKRRPPVVSLELVQERVVVLGQVIFAAHRAEVGQLEPARGLDLDDLPAILVRLPFVLALPGDVTALLPVGLHPRAEHVLLNLLGIGDSVPDFVSRGVDLGLGDCDMVGHESPSCLGTTRGYPGRSIDNPVRPGCPRLGQRPWRSCFWRGSAKTRATSPGG